MMTSTRSLQTCAEAGELLPAHTDTEAVAIIGMSGRFPGAPDIDAFWNNLREGTCSLSDFTERDLLADGVAPEELRNPLYVPAKGHLDGADRFEPGLFGFNQAEAAVLDPQHRLLLETAWSALEDAGYAPRGGNRRAGVYVGGSPTEHELAALSDPAHASVLGTAQVRFLTGREFLASWVSYRLGLTGPSMTVQTACSTSLTALHLAAQALLLGECDTALAGGVSLVSARKHGYLHHKGGTLSADGRCRPFDADADGTVPGNGVGIVVLRRLEDALADGDPVRAVLRGSAVTNDGAAKTGFTAPSPDQQTATILEAWGAAGLDPATAGYIEMHGTGTERSDRAELAAAAAAFADAQRCGIGSVKSSIGHLDAAAGVASLIKTVLMLQNGDLTATVNVRRPQPELLDGSLPFRLIERTEPWVSATGTPRRAGVTSLGIGGTNVHVVLEEAPIRLTTVDAPRVEVLPLSAGTAAQLRTMANSLAETLHRPDAPPLAAVGHTLRTGRSPFPVRGCVVASRTENAASALGELAAGTVITTDTGADELAALSQAWVRGNDVTWPAPLDEETPRVHLPTYPFAGKSHGALRPGTPGRAPAAAAAADGVEARVTEPLCTTLGAEPADTLETSASPPGTAQ
ncbi:polyketide synthase [Streptomyces sp. SID12501]|uniref:Polyketide synthase n=1 Tax=Streptomyces sp. SID12501 TaxID=2706042 RepID=A0A6B3C4I6_9ACTN|nr:polyketide synthase [Streptomyces sp. SID12501]NEC91737.1 polyketide synthase [Streptomyces sp. SID12501]